MGRLQLDDEQRSVLDGLIPKMSFDEAADEMNSRFSGMSISRQQVRAYANRNHIKCGARRKVSWAWPDEMKEYFAEIVPGHTEGEIRDLFEKRYGVVLKRSQIKNMKCRIGVKSGTTGGRFEKGHVNKPMTEEHRRRFIECGRATRFDVMPQNARRNSAPIGAERTDGSGVVWVKVKEWEKGQKDSRVNWKQKNRLVWEQHHGEIPEGCKILFIDGNHANFDIENLACVENKVLSVMNRIGAKYYDRQTFDLAVAMAKMTMLKAEKRRSVVKKRAGKKTVE